MSNDSDLINKFEGFYRDYCRNGIGQLAQKYPNEKRSLYVDWEDLSQFDSDLADDFIVQPKQMREYAEKALELYDLPVDVELGQAHVRVKNLPKITALHDLGARHAGQLVQLHGIIRSASDRSVQLVDSAFECQRCGTLTRIPQSESTLSEPHECMGCERSGPFEINRNQSTFVDSQQIDLIEIPSTETDTLVGRTLEMCITDDLVGNAPIGTPVMVTAIATLVQHSSDPKFFDINLQPQAITPAGEDIPPETPTSLNIPQSLGAYTAVAQKAIPTIPPDIQEEGTKAKLITPFIQALGWDIYDSREVQLEYSDAATADRVDYALFAAGDTPDILVEAKRFARPLTDHTAQIKDYLRLFEAPWGILTNGQSIWVYQNSPDNKPTCTAQVDIDQLDTAPILTSLHREQF